jgi:hypothetical protein
MSDHNKNERPNTGKTEWLPVDLMTCEWCGKDFPADARACVEGGIDAYHPPEDGEEWKGYEPVTLKPEDFSLRELEGIKDQLGINDTQLEELLRTGKVEELGGIVC